MADIINQPPAGNPGLELFGSDISGKGPKSFTGLDPEANKQLLSSLMPQLTGSIGGINQNIDQFTDKAAGLYDRTGRNALKRYMPGVIDRLSSHGILNSDTGEAALSGAMNQMVSDSAGKSFEAGMEGARMKQQVPGVLGSILGQTRTSQASDDLAPYSMLLNNIRGMM